MQEDEILILIDALKQKRVEPANQVSQIDTLISKYEFELKKVRGQVIELKDNDSIELSSIRVTTPTQPLLFVPNHSGIQDAILEALERYKHPLKTTELAEILQDYVSKDFPLAETLRKMQRVNKLKLMKVNNSNKLSYWVKTDWIDKGDKKLKEGYTSDNIMIVEGLDTIEFS